MTDETYTFISDVKEKKSVARSGGKKGKSRRGCSLPSDNLSTKEKRQMNGDMVSISMDRPISYAKFQSLSAEVQKEYLQHVIDNHGGNTARIASMFGIEESQVKKLRQNFGVVSSYTMFPDDVWTKFLVNADFLKKPMTWETFKTLDKFDQQDYLDFLYKDRGGATNAIAEMFGISGPGLMSYARRHGLVLGGKEKCGRHLKNDIIKWNEFVKKPENKDEVPMDNKCPEIPLQDAKAVLENANASAIEDITMTITVKSFDDIKNVLDTLPKVKKGNITFIFGAKSYTF